MARRRGTNGRYFSYRNSLSVKYYFLKYCFFPFIFIFVSNLTFSQSVYFDPPIFDFNIIHENNGIVYHEFKLVNTTLENYKIKKLNIKK